MFQSWAASLRQDAPALIAIDGKTSRGSLDRGNGRAALHLVSAFATTSRLVLGQEAVPDKRSELSAIPVLLERLGEGGGLQGALVSIDAIATNPSMAKAITDKEGDYLLALKRNQPTLHDEVAAYFDDPATTGLATSISVDKDHGRIETRTTTVSHEIGWLEGGRRHPGEHRFHRLRSIVRATTQVERQGKTSRETRFFISSALLTPERAATAIRSHWGIESLHWVLDVVFKEDQSRLRRGHGAQNMALVRRLAFNLVRAGKGNRSIKTARKAAGWNTNTLAQIIHASPR
jgi:predicted transposase YbfD/YdcC